MLLALTCLPGRVSGHGHGYVYKLGRTMHEDSGYGTPVCAPGTMYTISMSDLSSIIPNFTAPSTDSCGERPRSLTNPAACIWHPWEFLGMLYDR